MDQQRTINTSQSPDVQIEQIGGNLLIKGWDNPQVAIYADPETLHLQEQDDHISLGCDGDCEIRLPVGATLQIGTVGGNASLKLLEEPLSIDTVHGNLALRNVADASLGRVHGELMARSIDGDLKAEQVDGNADVRNVEGDCQLGQVDGNLGLQEVQGSVTAEVDGNARLRFGQMTGEAYRIEVDGNIQCTIPEDAALSLELASDGERIQVQLPGEARNLRQAEWKFRTAAAGESGPAMLLALSAGGNIQLMAQKSDWGGPGSEPGPAGYGPEFSEQIARQVESQISQQMAEMTRRINQQMEEMTNTLNRSGIPPEETERIVADAMRTSEQETARAQEKMRRAQEKLERKLDAAQRKAEAKAQAAERRQRGHHSWGFEWPAPPTPPTPPSRPAPPAPPAGASEEERLLILRMLEQKKISLEEADRLLSALEGKE
jgi:hypothetical protein